jgi:hypothetical protein
MNGELEAMMKDELFSFELAGGNERYIGFCYPNRRRPRWLVHQGDGPFEWEGTLQEIPSLTQLEAPLVLRASSGFKALPGPQRA